MLETTKHGESMQIRHLKCLMSIVNYVLYVEQGLLPNSRVRKLKQQNKQTKKTTVPQNYLYT